MVKYQQQHDRPCDLEEEIGMHKPLLATLTALPLLLPTTLTAQGKDARAIIDKAILAQGGLETLLKAEAGYRKVKGTFNSDNFEFTGDSYSDNGNRLKISLRGTRANSEVRILVMDGTKGWTSFNGAVFEFDEKQQTRMRRASHADKVAGLISLVREKGYRLTVLGESKLGQSLLVGIKVEYAGMPDMQLYFDKDTGFLVKTRYLVIDQDTDQEVVQEVYYSKFEIFDPAAEPLEILNAAKVSSANDALLKFLEERIPDKEERLKIQLQLPELGRASYAARQRASAALQKFGPKAAAYLREAAKSEDREVVRRAEQLLDQIGQTNEPAWTAAVVRLLAVRRPEGTAAALLKYYPWACDETVAKETLYALTALVEVDPAAKAVVKAALKDPEPRQPEAATMVLGKDGGAFLKEPGRRVLLEGIRFARVARIFRSGKLNFEMETFDHQFFNRFDDSMFARP
jgi:hypothetical protein